MLFSSSDAQRLSSLSAALFVASTRTPCHGGVRAEALDAIHRGVTVARPVNVMPTARLTLLGTLLVRLDDGPEVTGLPRKAQALLAFLALPPGRPHERDRLAALLWGDSTDRAARHSLRQTLSLLRQGVPGIAVEGDRVLLRADSAIVDVADFERLARRRDAASLAAAAGLYAGELLQGFHVDAEPFDEWQRGERGRLHEIAVETLAQLLAIHSRAGATAEAIRVALRLLELDPLQEPVHRALMRLYLRQGRRAAALNQYESIVERLRTELGAEPESETCDLYQALLRRVPIAARGAPITGGVDDVDTGGTDPPLVGRDLELARLGALADGARRDGGRAVVLLAEAGGGKTRVLGELLSRWIEGGGRTMLGRCREIERTVPLAVWIDGLARDISPADIDRVLGPAHPARRQLSRLRPDPSPVSGDVDVGRHDRSALFDAVAEVVTRLAAERPLLVALEDLHWADRWSLELVARVARLRIAAPLLLALTARTEELVDATAVEALLHELSRDSCLETLRLPPLSPDQVTRLVRSMAGASAPAAEIERMALRAWRMSEGNPLLAVEATRGGASAAPRGRTGAAVSYRARSVMDARLRKVSAGARHLAELGAVIGREFEFRLIAAAARRRPREAATLVDELVRRRIFHANGEQLEFTHDVLRELLAAELPRESLAELHRAVAGALARHADHRSPALAQRLAHHSAQAGMTARAVDWLARYAEQSLRVFAADEAVRALEGALTHVAALPAARRAAKRLPLLLQLAPALAMTGRFREILDRLLPEEAAVERAADARLAATYYFRVVLAQVVIEDTTRLEEMSRRGLEAARRTGDPGALGRMLHAVSGGCVAAGRPRAGIDDGRRAVALLERAGDRRWLAFALWVLGVHHLVAGELDAALDAETRSMRVATAAGDSGVIGFAATCLAWIHVERGDFAAAEAQCHDVLRSPGEPLNTVTALGMQSLVRLDGGDVAGAVAVLAQVVEQLPTPTRREVFAIPLGEALVASGEIERARALVAQAEAAAASSGSRWRHGRALRLASLIAEAEGRTADADRLLAQALEDLEAVPAPLEVARTHTAGGVRAAARGDLVAARRLFTIARDRYVALGVPRRAEAVDRLRAKHGA
jgi:DNA-binding SARP family transcriptional activator/predicted negative regulator of RcsB-dependent stress response